MSEGFEQGSDHILHIKKGFLSLLGLKPNEGVGARRSTSPVRRPLQPPGKIVAQTQVTEVDGGWWRW